MEGEAIMGQPVAFFEIVSADAERARAFYTELFGWTAEADPAMGGYALVDTGAGEDAIGGGAGPPPPPRRPRGRKHTRAADPGGHPRPGAKRAGAPAGPPPPPPPAQWPGATTSSPG